MIKMRYAVACYYLSHINYELPAIKLLLKMIPTYQVSFTIIAQVKPWDWRGIISGILQEA